MKVKRKKGGDALKYVLKKAAQCNVYNVFPVVGKRKVERLQDNIAELEIWLGDG